MTDNQTLSTDSLTINNSQHLHCAQAQVFKIYNYAPYRPGPFKMTMDLQRLDLADWIEIDASFPAELAERRRLLTERHADVFAALPEALPGSTETLTLLVEHLLTYFPDIFQMDGSCLRNRATGEAWNLADNNLHPLELAGRLVQEDLCLMGQDSDTGFYKLTAACLCFPSHWRLAEKMGKPLGAIHTDVPHYENSIGTPMNKLFDRLKVDKPIWRLNWSVVDDPALFQPRRRPRQVEITAQNAGDLLWLRIERQTLRRLPHSGDILFTIRIHNNPLSSLAGQPERAAQLATALRGLDAEMRSYKDIEPILEQAVGWLEDVSSH